MRRPGTRPLSTVLLGLNRRDEYPGREYAPAAMALLCSVCQPLTDRRRSVGDRGRHARSAVGMQGLPSNTPVEIEMIVEVAP